MDPESVKILLVGDEKCGKTTFLSFVVPRLDATVDDADANSYRRLSAGEHTGPVLLLRDIDQPFFFEIKLGDKAYRLEFFDTSCPENWRTLDPDVVVICYDISQRLSLINMKRYVSYPTLKYSMSQC